MVSRPDGYPRELERRITLADGRRVFIRPVVPGDANALVHAVRTADPATLRARFLGGAPPTDRATIIHLVTLDYVDRLALAAFGDGRGVGLARYEAIRNSNGTPTGSADVAVVVDPVWRRVGLASALLRLLAEAAAARGITRFVATYYATNADVAAIIAETGLVHWSHVQAGLVNNELPLPHGPDGTTVGGIHSG